MEKLRISTDDDNLDWEDPVVDWGPIYNDEPFTGIIYSESEGWYSEASYLEGRLDGKSFMMDTGLNRIIREAFYWEGVRIGTHFQWIDNFSEKFIRTYEDGELLCTRVEDNEGNLLLEYNRDNKSVKEWFTNGVISSIKILYETDNYYQFQSEDHWNKENIWLMSVTDKTNFLFNEDYLMNHSFDLETEQQNDIYCDFLRKLLEKDVEKALSYLHKNLEHPEPSFRYDTIRLLNKINDIGSIPFLEKRLDDNIKPEEKMVFHWGSDGSAHSRGFECTIAKLAKTVLEDIRKKNNI